MSKAREHYELQAALAKSSTFIDIVDAATDLLTPIGTLVIIDGERLEREVLKGSIADADVQRYLPFYTRKVAGDNFVHIQNRSGYTVETNSHFIHRDDTLCKKAGSTFFTTRKVTCPGCLAKGKSIIVNHLLKS